MTPHSTGAYSVLQVADVSGRLEIYQNVTSNPLHRHISPEELRLNDYANGRGLVVRKRSRDFVPVAGLVAASIPEAAGRRHRSCRTPTGLSIEFGSASVILRVGKDGEHQDFLIHRDLITRHSALVKQALRGEWKEAQDGVLPMPEDEPAIVKLYQQWLYTGCIFSDQRAAQEVGKEYEKLVKCYVLGEKLLDAVFKDCLIDAIISLLLTTQLFNPSLTDLVYDCTPQGSPLRRLWQDVYVFGGSSSWLDDSHDPHPDFMIDLSKRQMGFWRGQRPQDGAKVLLDPCEYHEHGSQACYRSSSVPVFDDGSRGVVSSLWS